MARWRVGQIALVLSGTMALTACEDGKDFSLFQKKGEIETADRAANPTSSVKLVERDVEAPEVFQASDQGLWDGRPSLGGVWIAHPDVQDPERVIIRNEDNGKFVIGALFRRERDNPGPRLQVSSDAAAALGMLAGAPGKLNVTALRRAEVPIAEEVDVGAAALPAPAEVETASLDPIAAASAALDEAEAAETTSSPAPAAAPRPPAAPAAAAATAVATAPAKPAGPAGLLRLSKPYIQIGMFGVEENAERAESAMRNAGVVPNVDKTSSDGKDLWRITVGPVQSRAERSALMKTIKGLGYKDAYYVAN